MSKKIITIGRTYGSGGRLIGREVAERLGIAFYDEELIDLAAGESGFSPDYIRAHEQRTGGSIFAALSGQGYSKDTLPPSDMLFVAQCRVIQQVAEREDCVIVGRCADYILRDFENCLHVFVRSTPEDCLHRVTSCYGIPGDKAAEEIKKVNRQRGAHCKRYTDRTWGAAENYDMMLNTARLGLEGCADLICAAAERAFSPKVEDVVYGD
jgi:hypothetical protein